MFKRLQGGNYIYCHRLIDSDLQLAKVHNSPPKSGNSKSKELLNQDMLRKRKDRFINICLNNDFKYFITLTYDSNSKYSTNELFSKSVIRFFWELDNDIKYILVPEYHKSGRLHYHVLIDRMLVGSYTDLEYKKVKNIYFNKWGIHEIKAIGDNINDYERVIYYLAKYLQKQKDNIYLKNIYSKNLNPEFRDDLDLIDYEKKIKIGTKIYKNKPYLVFYVPKENIKKLKK
ncbi:MAG: hypothetical protein QXW48_03930 [Thermoplasmata archaeon]